MYSDEYNFWNLGKGLVSCKFSYGNLGKDENNGE